MNRIWIKVATIALFGVPSLALAYTRWFAEGEIPPFETSEPTALRVESNGTFDCTAGLSIPSLSYRSFLPPTGSTEIEIPPQKTGSSIKGICSMGMYNFEVKFN